MPYLWQPVQSAGCEALGLFTCRVDDHSLGNLRLAGTHRFVLAFDFDHAQTTPANGLKIGMFAQMRNVDAGIERGLQDILPFACLDLGSNNR